MKRNLVRTAVLLAFLTLAAAVMCAAEPKAVIEGDPVQSVLPGDLVVLKTEGSVGTGYSWMVHGPDGYEDRYFVTEDGKVLVFAARKEGVYIFVLAVCEEGKTHQAKKVLLNYETDPDPEPEPTPNPYAPPNADWKAAVEPITKAIRGGDQATARADSARIAEVFSAIGKLSADTAVADTTAELKSILVQREKAAGLEETKGRYPGLGTSLENLIANALGTKNKKLSDDDRKMAAVLFESIAWAVFEGGQKR